MIYIKVSENGMLHTFDCTISDSVRYETVKFDFPKSWDGYTKTAVFRNGDIILSVILNSDSDLCVGADECYIPHEVIKAPEFTVSVFGVSGDSRVTASQAAIRVIQSGYGKGGEPSDPTPSEYEQLITLANETKEIARSVRTDADNGVFKGDPFTYADFTPEQLAALKGEKGDPGEVTTAYVNNTFANALKGTASGSAILIDDISPITHDMSVKVRCKNLFDLTSVLNASNWDSSLFVSGYGNYPITGLLPNTDYTLSMGANGWSDVADNGFYVSLRQETGSWYSNYSICHNSGDKGYCQSKITIKSNGNGIIYFNFYNVTNERLSAFFEKCPDIQLELGTTATAYTPYVPDLTAVRLIKKNASGKIISEYIPNPDGTVEGVTSFAPNEIDIWDGTTVTAPSAYGTGTAGTAENPYIIYYPEELAYVAQKALNEGVTGYYKLANDIYLNNVEALVEGETTTEWYNRTDITLNPWVTNAVGQGFHGTLDGDGYVIRGLYSDSTTAVGLFGQINNGTVNNLGIESSYLVTTGSLASAFSAKGGGTMTFNNCYADSSVILSSTDSCGAFFGQPWEANVSLTDCYSSVTVLSTANAAGSIGGYINGFISTNTATFTRCYSTGARFLGYKGDNMCVFVDCYADDDRICTGSSGNTQYFSTIKGLYSDADFTKLSTDDMKGANATINMTGFDWDNVWRIEGDELPKLRNFSYGAVLQLVTNADGVQIYCEYNKDTKAAYDFIKQSVDSVRNYADNTFATITALSALASVVDNKKITYRQYAQNEKLVVEKSKFYIVKAFPANSNINLWVTDSSNSETQAYAEDGDVFPDCSVGILISPDTTNYNGIYFIEITGKMSITKLNPFHDARFANWSHSSIKNLFLKSTASDGMAVWTIAL